MHQCRIPLLVDGDSGDRVGLGDLGATDAGHREIEGWKTTENLADGHVWAGCFVSSLWRLLLW